MIDYTNLGPTDFPKMKDLVKSFTGQNEEDKGRITFADISMIHPNPLNKASMSEIESLAENIKSEGLLQPLVVKITKIDGEFEYYIHTGHRRFEAIKKVIAQQGFYKYMGRELKVKVPCIELREDFQDDVDEQVSLMRSNSYRHYDKEERRAVVQQAHDLYEQLAASGRRPVGRERDWICEVTGIGDFTVKSILAELNQDSDKPLSTLPETPKAKKNKQLNPNKELQKLNKLMEKMIKASDNGEWSISTIEEETRVSACENMTALLEKLRK